MFTVFWHPAAEDELTALWIAADSTTRAEITAMVNRLDKEMKANPTNVGNAVNGTTGSCSMARSD